MASDRFLLTTIKARKDFVSARSGARFQTKGFVLQSKQRDASLQPESRFGFTVTKKTGNSVERNRIKRRLRAAVMEASKRNLQPGCDYVLIGKRAALHLPFDKLVDDLATALDRIANKREKPH